MITMRVATPADLPAILELYRLLDLADGEPLTLAQAQQIYERMQSYPDYKLYVATNDTAIIGTFALLIMDNLAHAGTPSGIIEDVVVAQAWQGQGVGRAMMEFAMRRCQEAGCYKLVLSTNSKRTAAHRFYENLGFSRHGYSYVVS